MNVITIPKTLFKEKELILMPRSAYEEFLRLREIAYKKIAEEKDTDSAVAIYKKEKKQGKLKVLKSLAELN